MGLLSETIAWGLIHTDLLLKLMLCARGPSAWRTDNMTERVDLFLLQDKAATTQISSNGCRLSVAMGAAPTGTDLQRVDSKVNQASFLKIYVPM